MTNLSLPTLTHANLNRLLGKRESKTIGYATVAVQQGAGIALYHHNNPIALLGMDSMVAISKGGWDSNTTAHRLNRILKDNGIAESVGVRKGTVSVIRDCGIRPLLYGAWAIWKNGSLVESSLNS